MTTTAGNVRVAVTGAVYKGATSTAAPTTATSTLASGFTTSGDQGYISEDGITQSIASETTDIKMFQNGDVVRTVQTSSKVTYQMAFGETSATTLASFFGNYTATDSTSGVSEISGSALSHYSWVINILDADARLRLYIPDGQITERGDTSFVNGAPVLWPFTITAYPVNGINSYLFQDTDINTSS